MKLFILYIKKTKIINRIKRKKKDEEELHLNLLSRHTGLKIIEIRKKKRGYVDVYINI